MMITKETIRHVVRTRKFAVIASSVISLAGGAIGGFSIAKRQLETKYAEISEREIQEAKLFYQQKNKAGDFSDPTTLAEKYGTEEVSSVEFETDTTMVRTAVDILENQKYTPYDKVSQSQEETVAVRESIQRNVFDTHSSTDEQDDDEFDLDDELDKKAEGKPYILEHEEFMENEDDHSQTTLTYYEEDDVLVDTRDQPITNVQGVVGVANLKFGHGSKDKNIVYICNPVLNADYEVVRSNGSYAREVLGFIQHSDKRSLRKFRIDD